MDITKFNWRCWIFCFILAVVYSKYNILDERIILYFDTLLQYEYKGKNGSSNKKSKKKKSKDSDAEDDEKEEKEEKIKEEIEGSHVMWVLL